MQDRKQSLQVLGSCSHLEELYFLGNQLSETVPSDHNLADFFDGGFSPKLQRYHLQIGSDIVEKGGPSSKMLSISPFVASASNATINNLVLKSEVLFLENIHGGCKNIIPDIVPKGGMKELNELLLLKSDEIEYLVDASRSSNEADPVLELKKLRITRMERLVVLCKGQPPPGLFGKLEEPKMTKCGKLQSIGDLELSSLKVLELEECEMLTSLFSPTVAQCLVLLQVLKITKCNELKHIIADQRSEIVSDDKRTVFPKLEELSVTNCHQMEYLIPVSLAMDLQRLEILEIYQANSMRYVLGQSEWSLSDIQNQNEPQSIQLPALKKLKLEQLPRLIGICSEDYSPSWPSLYEQNISECPELTIKTIGSPFKKKIVMKVQMNSQKCRSKALKVAAAEDGVNFVGLDGEEKDRVVVIGERVDAVKLTKSLRKKFGNVVLCSIAGIMQAPRNDAITKNQKIFEESVQKSPVSKHAKKVTFLAHDSETGDSTPEILAANSLCETSTRMQQTVKETAGDVPALDTAAMETSSVDSELTSRLTAPLHETPSPSNIETMKQIVQEPMNPSQKEFAQEFMSKQPRNEAMMTDRNALEETKSHSIKVSVQGSPVSLNASKVDSTAHDSKSGSSTPMHLSEKSPEALDETNQTLQRLDKPSNLTQKISLQDMEEKVSSNETISTNEQSIDGRPEGGSQDNVVDTLTNSEPGTLISSQPGQIKPHRTEIYNQEDTETDPINLPDFNDDDLIILLQSMKDDDDIIVLVPSVSGIPAEHPFHKDKQLHQAIASLEAFLKMPLNDIANSKNRIVHLEKTLNFLSSHYWADGALFDGLKATIDTLHQELPIILSSYKEASTTMGKYNELEEKEKSIKRKHPQRMEVAKPLVSSILKTKKTMDEAQKKEKYLKEQISRLQVELENTERKIKDCEACLFPLEEQKDQFHENAIGLKNEFQTAKKERLEIFEDQRKAKRDSVKWEDKWSALCGQFEEKLIAAKNLS